jgi:hypothetical protein
VGATLVKLAIVGAAIAGLSGGGYAVMRAVSAEQATRARSIELPAAAPVPAHPLSQVALQAPPAPVVPPAPVAENPPPAVAVQAAVPTTAFVPARIREGMPPAGHEALLSAPAVPAAPLAEPQTVISPPQAPVDALQGELALVRAAHDALREGRPAVALERMDEHRRVYPDGALSEERDALRVGALCALGRSDAQAEARAFLVDHPASPFVARVREACLR